MKSSVDLNSGNDSEDFIVTLSSNRGNYKSSNIESISNGNNDKSHDVQKNKILQEKNNKRIFFFSDSIVKHLKGCKEKNS